MKKFLKVKKKKPEKQKNLNWIKDMDKIRAILDRVTSLFYWHGAVAHTVKDLPAMQETRVQSLGWEDLLEKGMAIPFSILVWRIHGQRSLVGNNPWDHKESETTERPIHTHNLLAPLDSYSPHLPKAGESTTTIENCQVSSSP